MGWLDVLVAVLIAGFWIAVAVVLLIEGAELIHVALVLILGGAMTLYWLRTSWTLETLKRWRDRER